MSSYRQGVQSAVEYGALPEIDENATTLVVERQVAENDRHMVFLFCAVQRGARSQLRWAKACNDVWVASFVQEVFIGDELVESLGSWQPVSGCA